MIRRGPLEVLKSVICGVEDEKWSKQREDSP